MIVAHQDTKSLHQSVIDLAFASFLLPAETKKLIMENAALLNEEKLKKALFALQKERDMEIQFFTQILDRDPDFFQKIRQNIAFQFREERAQKECESRREEEDILAKLENEIGQIFS